MIDILTHFRTSTGNTLMFAALYLNVPVRHANGSLLSEIPGIDRTRLIATRIQSFYCSHNYKCLLLTSPLLIQTKISENTRSPSFVSTV